MTTPIVHDSRIQAALSARHISYIQHPSCECPGCEAHDSRCNENSKYHVPAQRIDGSIAHWRKLCSLCTLRHLPQEFQNPS